LVPWIIITLNAAVWVLLDEFELGIHIQAETAASLYNLVLTTALAFLLVFRLNRGAVRWWDTRGMWGLLVAEGRNLSISILEHVSYVNISQPNFIDVDICTSAEFHLIFSCCNKDKSRSKT